MPVLDITFDQLKWPKGYVYPWLKNEPFEDPGIREIVTKVGPDWSTTAKGAGQLNVQFFAELVKLKLEVVFEETENSFYLYDPVTGLWNDVTNSRMEDKAGEVCLKYICKLPLKWGRSK